MEAHSTQHTAQQHTLSPSPPPSGLAPLARSSRDASLTAPARSPRFSPRRAHNQKAVFEKIKNNYAGTLPRVDTGNTKRMGSSVGSRKAMALTN